MKYLIYLCLLLFFFSCARSPLKNVADAMRPAKSFPLLNDNLSKESFFTALKNHITTMKKSAQVSDPMIFGKVKIPKAKYINALEKILEHENDWTEWIRKNFDFYEVYGRKSWGEVLATGYYEPQVSGSHTETEKFSQPIYGTPPDLVTINLKKFGNKFQSSEFPPMLQGRLRNHTIIPYYDRKEIDVDKKLKNQNLEIAWVDPIDAFFIQIQGSGVVEFENGEKIRVGYADQNGHPYQAIGKFLTDVIPMEEMSLQRIKAYLRTLPFEKQQNILDKNPSYVFFKKLETDALTYAGMEVSDGRTIATDSTFFPKGALAFLDIEEPVFEKVTDSVPVSWKKSPRFVLDQDTGGAIRGGDRVDLYFGKGEAAFQKAGVMKRMGFLYYLVPKN